MQGKSAISKSRSIPMSLNTFQLEAKQHWKFLKEEELALADAYTLFSSRGSIWPDQCERVLALLYRIKKSVQELYTLLREPANLPSSIVQHRYHLLMSLQRADEQLQALIPLITSLRIVYRISPKQSVKQRNEVQQRLEILIKVSGEALNNFQSLFDLARFQERKARSSLLSYRGFTTVL